MRAVRLLPLFKDRPWGVRNLSPWFEDEAPDAPVGEAWFTSNENPLAGGGTLGELIARAPADVLGRESVEGSLPLLVKLLFTSDRLSVQVHPDDAYARLHHGSRGKTEAWQVLEATTAAHLGLGFTRPLVRDEAAAAASNGDIEHLLDWRPTRAGDTWLVPAGTVHAIGAGLTILEVQENSDVTYRLYDYGRPRPLHLDRGLEVAELEPYTLDNAHRLLEPGRERLTTCEYFTLERWTAADVLACTPGEPFYHLLVVTAGRGVLGDAPTRAGDVWLVPAAAEPFTLRLDAGEVVVAYTSPVPTRAFAAA